jgi:N6-L-threonylcarbamoyladenine synthase
VFGRDPDRRVRVLGIETSCDETAVAIVEGGFSVRANLIASQVDLHRRFGGVVPEVAARAHVEMLNPLLEEALEQAALRFSDLDGVAVTRGPGLVGALIVGLAGAKAIALTTGAAFVAVNHLEGHIYANFLEHGPPAPPYVCLVVSGGHTMLVHMPEEHHYELLGQTLDDAAGEAFDKVARFIGLEYPGGPALDRAARAGNPEAVRFPRAMEGSGDFDFSMSGLKTAVVRYVKAERAAGREPDVADLAASFQEAIVDVQVTKTIAAAREHDVRTVLLGGGVVANTRLRERMQSAGDEAGIEILYPSTELCTDNAAMIACAGASRLAKGERSSLDVGADPGLELAS